MARAVKKELSIEEKMAAALVPENEQPYKVPDNWCWVYLSGILLEIKNGTTAKQDKSGKGYSVTRIESLQNQTIDFNRLGTIVDESAIKEADWYVAGDIALSHINSAEHVGKTALITEGMLPLVHGMNLLRMRFIDALSPIMFQYYTRSFQWKEAVLSRINMAVNQVSINQKQVGSIEFPLPPYAEQQRIVNLIESLFADLDEAKEKLTAVLEGFAQRKAAILHQAFTGELTEKWREEHKVDIDSWEDCLIKDVFDMKAGKNIKAKEIFSEWDDKHRYPCFGGNGIRGYVCVFNESGNYPIIGRQGALCGNVHLASGNFYATEHAVVVKQRRETVPRFSELYLSFLNLNQYATAVAQPGLAVSKIVEIPIKYVPFDEQKEIVRILDELFEQEQQAQSAIESVIADIDTLKKSILARAFRGELNTNEPSDESAIELLKRIL